MRHRRSIDLSPSASAASPKILGDCAELPWLTGAKLARQYCIAGRCAACGHVGWLQRWAIEARFGENAFFEHLRPHLRCVPCGNRKGNSFVLGKT